MLTHANAHGGGRDASGESPRTHARRTPRWPTCPWRGRATRSTRCSPAWWSASAPTARRARRRCSATCASWARRPLLAPPRIWENMLTAVQVRAADATSAEAAGPSSTSAERPSGPRSSGPRASRCPLGLRLATALGEFFVYGPVRDQLGLGRAKWALTGGAPLGPDTFRFFRSIGVNLKQVYGSTETTGLVSLQPDAEANPTTAGRPVPGHRGQDRRSRRGARERAARSSRATSRTTRRPARSSTPRAGSTPGDAGFIDPRGPSRHHRPGQGRGRARRRHPLRAAVHREQAEVQPVHPGGGGLRPRAAVRDRHDRHRPRHGGELGRAPRRSRTPRYMDLSPEAGGARA